VFVTLANLVVFLYLPTLNATKSKPTTDNIGFIGLNILNTDWMGDQMQKGFEYHIIASVLIWNWIVYSLYSMPAGCLVEITAGVSELC